MVKPKISLIPRDLIINSYAKLNLYLEILRQRGDGYHSISTLFEKISLCDKIILKSRPDKKINIICKEKNIPKGKANFAYRSAELLQDKYNTGKGVDIEIIKRIPVGSGLGGGSSNAAAVLLGLNRLWKLSLTQEKLVNLAKKIGSDVPFFIYQCSFAEGRGRGEKIIPIKSLNRLKLWHILVVPKVIVPTAVVYRNWDKLKGILTIPEYDVKILSLALKRKDFSLVERAIFNGLEQVTIKLYPEVGRIKECLIRAGAKKILMSGSGSALFGIFSSRKEALSLCKQLKKIKSLRVFICRTI